MTQTQQTAYNSSLFVSSKRTIYEIYAEILQICQKPQNITHIMYQTNTSYVSFKKYLQQPQEIGLLKQGPEHKNRYKTTERGKTYLEKYAAFKQLLSSFEGKVELTNEQSWLLKKA
jgi:predicted transcriptional regulator